MRYVSEHFFTSLGILLWFVSVGLLECGSVCRAAGVRYPKHRSLLTRWFTNLYCSGSLLQQITKEGLIDNQVTMAFATPCEALFAQFDKLFSVASNTVQDYTKASRVPRQNAISDLRQMKDLVQQLKAQSKQQVKQSKDQMEQVNQRASLYKSLDATFWAFEGQRSRKAASEILCKFTIVW